tara:strand:- start:229 stop:924 length:696 start_codon:yes stop_codon:yes gene_type:complete
LELFDGILSDQIQSFFRYIGYGFLFYLLLIWFASVVWVVRDIANRTKDPISIFVAVAISLLLPFVGLPIYFILRPSVTLNQSFENSIEQQLLLTEMYNIDICSNARCRKPLKENWITCVYCGRQERKLCTKPDCKTVMAKKWAFCPTCSAPSEAVQQARQTQDQRNLNNKNQTRIKQAKPKSAPSFNITKVLNQFDFSKLKNLKSNTNNVNKKIDQLIKEKKDNSDRNPNN